MTDSPTSFGPRIFDAAGARVSRWALLVAVLVACGAPPSGFRAGTPVDHLPPHITPFAGSLTGGLRPAWDSTGRRFLYLDDLVGHVFEFDRATGQSRSLTAHFDHFGFTRAHYLANGDILLCGPSSAHADAPEGGRWHAEFWLLETGREQPAKPLGERCFEGPAVARNSMRIAWVRTDLPDKMLTARSEIWTGLIDPNGGRPRILEARRLVGRSDFYGFGILEPQDFRPPEENELLFTAYAWRGGEAMGVDLASGQIENYSRSPWYEEIEGVTPDGRYAFVEREFTLRNSPRGPIDLWLLRLDGSGDFVRMTRFSEFAGFGANNPVVRPDCRSVLFGLRETGGEHGNSSGLMVYDLASSPHTPADLCASQREPEREPEPKPKG